jgi:ATP-dependent exoDNAse (exonuclease V) beta subunit
MVFLPCLDEGISAKSSAVAIEENRGGGFAFRYEPEQARRKHVPEFERQKMHEMEEEKRLFYVAVTRAMDYLFMSGFDSDRPRGRLAWLKESFDLSASSHFTLVTEREIEERYAAGSGISLSEERHFLDEPVFVEPIAHEPELHLRDVTEDILVKTRHGKDWVLTGRLMHQVLEEISKGILPEDAAEDRAKLLVSGFVFEPERREKFLKTIAGDLGKLRKSGIMEEVVLPKENSFAELPFAHERGKTLFKGRIDRLVLKEGAAFVYDYKSFPVKRDAEMEELVEKYRFQMELYREAAEKLFGVPAHAFLVFTHLPLSVEI